MRLLAVILCSLISYKAMAQFAFKCTGAKSRYEAVQGWYDGAATDTVTLNYSNPYQIYNLKKPGAPLTLPRSNDEQIVDGLLKDFPVQYLAQQQDAEESYTTVFAIQPGALVKRLNGRFQAVLVTNEQHLLDCEVSVTIKVTY